MFSNLDSPPEWKFDFIWDEMKSKSKLWLFIVIQLSHCMGLCFILTFMERRRMRRKLLNILIHPEKPGELKGPNDLETITNNEKFVNSVEGINSLYFNFSTL